MVSRAIFPAGPDFPHDPTHRARRAIGYDAAAVRTMKVLLDNARVGEKISMAGNLLWVVNASSLDAVATVSLNEPTSNPFDISKGLYLAGFEFHDLWVSNAAQPGKWITLLYGIVDPDLAQVLNPASDFTQIKIDQPDTITTTADVSVAAASTVSVLAADSTRRGVVVQAPFYNTEIIRIGDASTGATRGIALGPGDMVQLDGTFEVFAFNPGAVAQFVSLAAIRD